MLRAIALSLLLSLTSTLFASESIQVTGTVDSVTVYRGQAMVKRVIDVSGPDGLREVVVGELPAGIVAESLFAEVAAGGEVRSVRYRVRPVAEDVREEVRHLDQQIQSIRDQIEGIAREKSVLANQQTYLGNLEQFAASTSAAELTHGVLNADTLKSLTLFMFEQRRLASTDLLGLELEERNLHKELDVLERNRSELSAGSSRTVREAVLFLNVTDPEGASIQLRYLVEGASWSPSYNVRASEGGEVVVEYQASIRQMSGEDWRDVDMTLSTATPSLVAKAPALVPLKVTLASFQSQQMQQAASGHYREEREQLLQQRDETARARGLNKKSGSYDDRTGEQDLDVHLNALASQIQLLDIMERRSGRRGPLDEQPETEGLSVSYKLSSRASLPSRSDQQLVQIAQLKMPAEFYRVATPVLTSYVYREADVFNSTDMVLLAGPASTYIDGQFVGHGEVPTVATGEGFNLGLGVDSTMRAGRELADRTETIQGGNRVLNFTYEIRLENFSGEAKPVRVLDRLPVGREPEVKVTLIDSDQTPVSGDSARGTDKSGLIRWDVEVPPTANGSGAFTVDYSYVLEYDKNMVLSGSPEFAQAN